MTALIHRAIRRSNARDYSAGEIERIIDMFSSTHVAEQFGRRIILVAMIGDEMVGTASLSDDGRRVHMVFVDPARQGEGLGARLMDDVELLAKAAGTRELGVRASRTAVAFYAARGYVVDGPESGGEIATLPMVKALSEDTTPP